ncbi:5964_t:CDS:2 [Gigaspora margarita]|uniref:5964_t:CDS:1 n=1 Tax=Gigaspora margarita TaxID=4874 RepID=A0ABM8VYE2_GIGMA|nr:5964_t:CDS:2 [Gigaspora margarita]
MLVNLKESHLIHQNYTSPYPYYEPIFDNNLFIPISTSAPSLSPLLLVRNSTYATYTQASGRRSTYTSASKDDKGNYSGRQTISSATASEEIRTIEYNQFIDLNVLNRNIHKAWWGILERWLFLKERFDTYKRSTTDHKFFTLDEDKELSEFLGINLLKKKHTGGSNTKIKKTKKETANKDIKEVPKGKEIGSEPKEQTHTIDSFTESKGGVDIGKLKEEINKGSIKELFEKENNVNLKKITGNIYERILEEHYTENQTTEAIISQTKDKEFSEYLITLNKNNQCKAEIALMVFTKKEEQLLKET